MTLKEIGQDGAAEPSATPPTHPRNWQGGINEYLQENAIVCNEVTALESGTSCYLWRLDGLNDEEARNNGHRSEDPVVLKCADSTPKYDSFPVAPDRLKVEVKALQSAAVAEACQQEPSVQVPRVLRTTTNGFVMTWGGEIDLRVAYKVDESLDVANIGARLGRWLACLHLAGIEAGDKEEWPAQNEELLKFYAPGGIEEQTIRAAFSNAEEVDRVLGVLRAPERVRTLTPWDFRPMNTLLRKANGGEPQLTIVDWELSQYGEPSADIRMWVAEAMVTEAKYGKRGMLSSFLSAYKSQTKDRIADDAFVRKVAVSAGVFILFLMPVAPQVWDYTQEEAGPWLQLAKKYIRAGAEGDMAWLRESCLKELLD